MKKIKIIYWLTTGLVAVSMALSAYMYFTNPDVKRGFEHAGFPDYFRMELGIAKLIGASVLLLPVAGRVKEWAYAGFGIVFISAIIAHTAIGDPFTSAVSPFVFLVLLVVSNISYHKLGKLNATPEKQATMKAEYQVV